MKSDFIKTSKQGHLTFFYDERSNLSHEIDAFLQSDQKENLSQSVRQPTYVALWGDGVFVYTAKRAFIDWLPVLGINFGTKGFLLHDQSIWQREYLTFETREYPMLHIGITIWSLYREDYAFNELYITRAGDASSARMNLSLESFWQNSLEYVGDGIMISTPAGSTGWSRSYGGVILPHDANLNVLTPIGKITPRDFSALVISDTKQITISNDIMRETPIDILLDNHRIVSMETQPFELTIKKSTKGVQLLIEKWYRGIWDAKTYGESGFITISPS
jgi:NAD+ kinase